MDVSTAFNEFAARYDQSRRQLIGPYDSFYSTAIDALTLARRPITRVLDLGAGTGLLSAMVRDHYPDVQVTLLDGASEMLAEAERKLGRVDGGREFNFIVADMLDPLPAGPWDAIVSSLAIHHLDDAGKQTLYSHVRDALEPGGVFVNAEQVAGPTACLEERYLDRHEHDARSAGASEADWQAALERMRLDRPATVEAQLGWLRACGFPDADCLFKDHRFAVLVAVR